MLSENAVRALPRVSDASPGKDRLEILTPSPETVLRELLRLDPALSDIEVTASGLEEAFLAIMQNQAKSRPEVVA